MIEQPKVAAKVVAVLTKANTHTVANLGLGIGSVTLATLFGFIMDPVNLIALYHRDGTTFAQLIGIVIAILLSLVAAYFGMPKNIPNDPTS